MTRWASLPISLAGRVSLIKMIVLAKFLQLFQNIPILIKKPFFKALENYYSSNIQKLIHWVEDAPITKKADFKGCNHHTKPEIFFVIICDFYPRMKNQAKKTQYSVNLKVM